VIYLVTVLYGDPYKANAKGTRPDLRVRNWGYYTDRASAQQVIEENQTDISECGYYQYAVLTSIEEGPLAIGEELQWYEFVWEWEPRRFVEAKKIEKPTMYQQIAFAGLDMIDHCVLDHPEDRLYHAADKTWWRRDKSGRLKAADPPPPRC
jgi:hypothetical protein